MRASALLAPIAWVCFGAPACSLDVDSFHMSDAHVDTAAADVAAPDTAAPDTAASPDTSVGIDSGDPTAAACKAKGSVSACIDCCGAAYPKGQAAVGKHTYACLCRPTTCGMTCDKTLCKPGAPKTPDDACDPCVRGALAGACSGDVAAARAEEPQSTVYLACTDGCH